MVKWEYDEYGNRASAAVRYDVPKSKNDCDRGCGQWFPCGCCKGCVLCICQCEIERSEILQSRLWQLRLGRWNAECVQGEMSNGALICLFCGWIKYGIMKTNGNISHASGFNTLPFVIVVVVSFDHNNFLPSHHNYFFQRFLFCTTYNNIVQSHITKISIEWLIITKSQYWNINLVSLSIFLYYSVEFVAMYYICIIISVEWVLITECTYYTRLPHLLSIFFSLLWILYFLIFCLFQLLYILWLYYSLITHMCTVTRFF